MKGRHALVTGGSRGIGRGIAAALVAAGATVTVLGRDRSALERAVGEGAAHAAAVGDVTDGAAIQAVIAKAESRNGPIDLLVANAGQAVSAPFAKSDEALFARMIDVNLMGVVHASRAVLDGMTGRGFGRIVAIASTAGLKGYPYVTAYCAAKHAVVGFVRALAAETAATGVTVNAVCPGFADTPLIAAAKPQFAGFPLLTAEDVADAIEAVLERGEPGECWFVQPGREPAPYGFRGVPGLTGATRPPDVTWADH
jgi:3-hydroxybutyrate dehydrogenase